MTQKKDKDDELFEQLGEIIEEMEAFEKEVERLEKIKNKTEAKKKELKQLKKDLERIKETANRANGYFLEKAGGPMALYYFVKQLAEQGDEQAKKDLESMKPFIHEYLPEENISKN